MSSRSTCGPTRPARGPRSGRRARPSRRGRAGVSRTGPTSWTGWGTRSSAAPRSWERSSRAKRGRPCRKGSVRRSGPADVDGVSFTGSVETGRAIARRVVERMGKIQLEMGGKNPLVVLDDADLPTAVSCAVNGAYFSTGQRCTASSRLIVTAGIHDQFVSALSERLGKLKVDDALAAGTDIGPVVDETQLKQDLE